MNKQSLFVSQLPVFLLGVIIGIFTSIAFPYLSKTFNFSTQRGCTVEAKLCPDGSTVGRIPPNCEFAPCPTTSESTSTEIDTVTGWSIFTNSTYGYSISAPIDFSLRLCKGCIPPEMDFVLYSSKGTIDVGAEYAHQSSLTANMSSAPLPVNNLEVIIQGKKYVPEEYFVKDSNSFIFKIDDVEKNGQSSQISLFGRYTSLDEAELVSGILSTFKFLDQNETQQTCGGWNISGEIICECTGEITKSVCPPDAICDSGTYYCEGVCGKCCYKEIAEGAPYPKCN